MLRIEPYLLLAVVLPAFGCQAERDEVAAGGADAGAAPRPDAAAPAPDVGSPDPVLPAAAPVRFKGGARLRADWARGLDLAPEAVCRELGRYDCATEVHNIVLGGVEPYVLNINRPLQAAPVTAPLAVDRMALAACGRAVERDLTDPTNAVIFRPEAGEWSAAARRAAHERLIEGLLKRRANDAELARLDALWTDAPTDDPREQAVTACFVVATSVESLFY